MRHPGNARSHFPPPARSAMKTYEFTATFTTEEEFTDEDARSVAEHLLGNLNVTEVDRYEVTLVDSGEIEMQPVQSSNVREVGFRVTEPGFGTLRVTFANGGTYEYAGVTQANYDALLTAPSVGQHLAAYVKPHHEFQRIS